MAKEQKEMLKATEWSILVGRWSIRHIKCTHLFAGIWVMLSQFYSHAAYVNSKGLKHLIA